MAGVQYQTFSDNAGVVGAQAYSVPFSAGLAEQLQVSEECKQMPAPEFSAISSLINQANISTTCPFP